MNITEPIAQPSSFFGRCKNAFKRSWAWYMSAWWKPGFALLMSFLFFCVLFQVAVLLGSDTDSN